MGGLFGGLLRLLETLGWGVLYLLIGSKASDKIRRGACLTAGGLTAGLPVGLILGTLAARSLAHPTPGDYPAILIMVTIGGAIGGVAITWGLEFIRRDL
jgi:hypothetical protein